MRAFGLKQMFTLGLLAMVALTGTGCVYEPGGYYVADRGWHHHDGDGWHRDGGWHRGYGWRE